LQDLQTTSTTFLKFPPLRLQRLSLYPAAAEVKPWARMITTGLIFPRLKAVRLLPLVQGDRRGQSLARSEQP
jgi:hypothetical protein